MKVYDYLKVVEINELLTEVFFLYPDQIDSKDGYVSMYYKLLAETPAEGTMRAVVEHVDFEYEDPELDRDDYISVHGIDPNSKEDEFGRKGEEISWSIAYNSWAEWLGMDVEVKTDDPRCSSDAKILAHIMWEMSWAGFTEEDVQKQKDEIINSKNEVDEILSNNTHEEAVAKGLLHELNLDDFKVDK